MDHIHIKSKVDVVLHQVEQLLADPYEVLRRFKSVSNKVATEDFEFEDLAPSDQDLVQLLDAWRIMAAAPHNIDPRSVGGLIEATEEAYAETIDAVVFRSSSEGQVYVFTDYAAFILDSMLEIFDWSSYSEDEKDLSFRLDLSYVSDEGSKYFLYAFNRATGNVDPIEVTAGVEAERERERLRANDAVLVDDSSGRFH